MELIYEGSVKNIYQDDDPRRVWFEFTDDYSVFDWGKMPDTIPGKGEILARLAEWFFLALADPGRWKALQLSGREDIDPYLPLAHHFVKKEGRRILVNRVDIPSIRATTVGGSLVYDYDYAHTDRQLLPLEVIFRFGVPAGSSLLSRKDWYPFDIHEGAEFDQPLIEFTTKLESRDRVLTYQEAALVLGGRAALLDELWGRTRAVSLFLKGLFADSGMKLWDGKLEWALCDGELTLVDSIGPDELRVSAPGGAVFSKQFLRDFYLGSPWEQAVNQGKSTARERGSAEWKTIVQSELNQQPEPLSEPYREAARLLYQEFHDILITGGGSTSFSDALGRL